MYGEKWTSTAYEYRHPSQRAREQDSKATNPGAEKEGAGACPRAPTGSGKDAPKPKARKAKV